MLIFSSELDRSFHYSFPKLHLHQAFMAVDGIGTVVSVLSGRVRTILASVVCFLGLRGPPIEPLIPSATILLLVAPCQPG